MTNQKPKLLLVSAMAPFPRDSGGSIRIWQTIAQLSKQFRLYLIFFSEPMAKLTAAQEQFLREKTDFFHVMPLQGRQLSDVFSRAQPFWFSPWRSEELLLIVNRLIKREKIELVQIEFTQLLYLAPALPRGCRKIFVAHDISTVSFFRRAQEMVWSKRKILAYFLCGQIYFYEKELLPQFDVVIAMSLKDQKILQKHFAPRQVICIPNGIEAVQPPHDKPPVRGEAGHGEAGRPLALGYIGSFAHPPNEMAFRFFVGRIAPLLEAANLPYRFYLAGKSDPELVQEIIAGANLQQPEQIINLGFVKEVADFYHRIDGLLAPIFSGSGTRLKILEALSYNLPVIASTIGAEGLDFPPPQLKIANRPSEFLAAVQVTEREIRDGITYHNQARLKKYLWSEIFADYGQQIKKRS